MQTPPLITAQHALFLDFDGTLTPLIDNPYHSELLPEVAAALPHIDNLLDGALAIISGRDVRNLSERCPHSIMRIGNHGMEICLPNTAPKLAEPGPEGLRTLLEGLISPYTGAWIEDKGPVCGIHYRDIPSAGPDLEVALINALAEHFPDYRAQHGKFILEAKPLAANKGYALKHVMRDLPFEGRLPIMVGDDTTDEDAFLVAQALGGFAIKVGEGETRAQYRLQTPQDVAQWLNNCL